MDLCNNYLIESLSDFKEILGLIISEVEKGNLEQFYKTDKVGYFEEDICTLKKSETYPDDIICFFYNKINSKKYRLAVNLYQGRGGYWKEIESEDKVKKTNLISNVISKFKK